LQPVGKALWNAAVSFLASREEDLKQQSEVDSFLATVKDQIKSITAVPDKDEGRIVTAMGEMCDTVEVAFAENAIKVLDSTKHILHTQHAMLSRSKKQHPYTTDQQEACKTATGEMLATLTEVARDTCVQKVGIAVEAYVAALRDDGKHTTYSPDGAAVVGIINFGA